MIAKIIVASIIWLISLVGLILAFNEVIKENATVENRAFFGTMIALAAGMVTIITMWFAFNI